MLRSGWLSYYTRLYVIAHYSSEKRGLFGGKKGLKPSFMLKKLCVKWELGKKSEPQMEFEPTTLRDLVGCSNL